MNPNKYFIFFTLIFKNKSFTVFVVKIVICFFFKYGQNSDWELNQQTSEAVVSAGFPSECKKPLWKAGEGGCKCLNLEGGGGTVVFFSSSE